MNRTKNPIHGVDKKKFFEKKWLVELLASGPPAGSAAYGVWVAVSSGISKLWIPLSLGLVWLLSAQCLKVYSAYRQDKKEDELRSHEGLIAAMHVLQAAVTDVRLREGGADPDVRATFHRVVPPLNDPQFLEQIIPYAGGKSNGQGRKFSIRSGITGCAVRDGKEVILMEREGQLDDDYRRELISEWHYTSADVEKMTMDRFSAIAIPVTDRTGHQVIGVVYLDAKEKKFFSSPAVSQLVIGACAGITKYVGVRYD